MTQPTTSVTRLLRAWGHGEMRAEDELLPLVYRELRRQAATCLRRERPDHTLQPSALVNEAYLRLVGQARISWKNRAHFFGVAAQIMRRILVDHARRNRATKRPQAGIQVACDERLGAVQPQDCQLLTLHQALSELTELAARQGQIVEMRYFGGMSEQDVAVVLGISRATVTREWRTAKAWLYQRLYGSRGNRS